METDAPQRRREVALAGHRGDLTTARGGLRDPAARVRSTALGALARAGGLTPDDLVVASADPEPEVRARAAELTAALAWGEVQPDHPAQELLVALLTDVAAEVVEAAAWAAGERAPPEEGSVRALATVAGSHEDPRCREAAVAALGAIGDPAGLPAVLAAIRDKPAVRRRAVLALAPFEGPEVDEALRRAHQDRDWQVRQAAEDLS